MRHTGWKKKRRVREDEQPSAAAASGSVRRFRGFVTVDVVTACVILALLFAVAVPVVSRTGALRAEARLHQLAVQEASNVLEKALLLPWDQLTAERLTAGGLSPAARTHLPDGRLNVTVELVDQTPRAKRVTVEVSWRRLDGQHRPVRLVAWFFEQKEQP